MYKFVSIIVVLVFSLVLLAGGGSYVMASPEKVTIDFPSWWWGEPGNVEFLNLLKQEFEKEYPNIVLNGYDVPWEGYWDKMIVETSAGRAPHIIHLLDTNMYQYINMGVLEPLDKWMDKTDIKQRFTRIQQEPPVVKDGKTYGLYQGIFNYISLYNKRLFAEKGIDVFPVTMDNFIDAAKKLTDPPNQYGYAIASRPGARDHMLFNLTTYVVGYGGKIDEVNSPQMIEAVTAFKKIFDAGVIPPDTGHEVFYPMFMHGKIACLVEGAYMYAMARDENPEILPDLAAAMPFFPTHKSTTVAQILAMAKDVDNKDAAWKFLEFWARPEWLSKQVEMTLAFTAEVGGGLSGALLEEFPWMYFYAIAVDTCEYPYNIDVLPYLPEINDEVMDHIEKIVFADAPIKETLDAAQEAIRNITTR